MIETIITHACPSCGSVNLVKNGRDYKGTQKFRGNDCRRYGTLNPRQGHAQRVRAAVERAFIERVSLRGLARVFGLSRTTVMRWLEQRLAHVPPLTETLREGQVNDVLELDEVWSFWQWVKGLLQDSQSVMAGLETDSQEEERQHSHLLERMTMIQKSIKDDEAKLTRLIHLFLEGEFDREVLLKRKMELEKQLTDLKYEQMSLQEHLDSVIMSHDLIGSIEAICAEISVGLDNATFEDKKRYFEILDVRGKVAFEDGKEVVYIKCKIGQQQVLLMQTSHLSNTGEELMMISTFP